MKLSVSYVSNFKSINRNIVECKFLIDIDDYEQSESINRNIVECKLPISFSYV